MTDSITSVAPHDELHEGIALIPFCFTVNFGDTSTVSPLRLLPCLFVREDQLSEAFIYRNILKFGMFHFSKPSSHRV